MAIIGMALRMAKYKLKWPQSHSSHYKLIYIDPSEIEYAVRPQLSQEYSDYGYHVINGDWDKSKTSETNSSRGTIPIDEYEFHKSMVSHFEKGLDWDETDFFRKALEQDDLYRGENLDEVKDNLRQVDELYDSIKKEGYKSQKELKQQVDWKQGIISLNHNEVKVDISRDGDFLFEDGRHRMSIAKILDLEEIPVRIVARHKEWQDIRCEIATRKNDQKITEKYKKSIFNHPDLQDII